jgi:hypothetical protein
MKNVRAENEFIIAIVVNGFDFVGGDWKIMMRTVRVVT